MQNEKTIELLGVGKKYPFAGKQTRTSGMNFEDFWALKEVSLDICRGHIIGVIGRNGAGKTTLLNIIASVLSPTEGKVNIKGRTLGLFNLGVGFQDELTGKENIFLNATILGARRGEIENKLPSIIAFSELGNFINLPLGTYSQGMRLRLGFSIIANLDFDILVIDEILAVGDLLFQNKCFEKLMDFKRAGKTLVITNQNLDLMERICDKTALLDHGKLLFYGETLEGINHYRKLLATENFFVGPSQKEAVLFENTKKWAQDMENWGKQLGTLEVIIEKLELQNRFGLSCLSIKSQEPLRVKVTFQALANIKEPHFGIAIFRNDGVYCYGPNTAFDGHRIQELKKGRGIFLLNFRKLSLAPGDYRISVAIWDKFETLAYNYHNGYYSLLIKGKENKTNELLNIPFIAWPKKAVDFKKNNLDLKILEGHWGEKRDYQGIRLEQVKFCDKQGQEKNSFHTNDFVKLTIKFTGIGGLGQDNYLWAGFYRSDRVYCQGIIRKISRDYQIIFPRLPLLPGEYKVSLGIWNEKKKEFLVLHHGIYPMHMVFNREDHGTVYAEHSWKWRQ
ncbi:MAG: Wzt carbohydrate-binding domain-containing protein [Candidatus Omnitrophica bacterium]|nr:Wzt carbohydrate-binding domain-containing protein [Candidatus Omnitrophota bacterium]